MPAARAESLVVGIALYVEALRILELGRVAIRRDVPHDDLVALVDGAAGDLGVLRRRPAEVRERREHADRLLDRTRDERRIVDQLLALLRVLAERDQGAAEG